MASHAAHDLGEATTLAVVVTLGDSPYLARTLTALARQRRMPDEVLIVDVSSPSRGLGSGRPVLDVVVEAALDEATAVRVIQAPKAATFGAAVRAGLAEHESRRGGEAGGESVGPGTHRWLWLLHDDSAPAPEALEELTRAASVQRSVGIAGAKQRDWARPAHLLQVGLRATASARRVPDIEPGEIDQGQHDQRSDTFAVGTAGMLVRRSVWDELGGPDPALGPFGDGLDLCRRAWLAGHRVIVVPSAIVHHARASYLGLRQSAGTASGQLTPDERRSYGARRRSQLHNWLVATPALALPLVILVILAVAPLRALGRIAAKDLGLVVAEMRAAAEALASPRAIVRGRRRARGTRKVSRRYLRPLLARGRDIRRARRDLRRTRAASRLNRIAPSELELAERAALARRRRATGTVVVGVLVVVALLAFAPLLAAGPLSGGALWPLDVGLGGLWQAATSGWIAAGLGHAGPADPFTAVLALLATPLGGSSLTTTVLVVAAIPLAGVGAWFAAGAAARSVLLRGWAALMWGTAPALLLATGSGRLGAIVAHLALPWVALGVAHAVGVRRVDVIDSGLVGAALAPEAGPALPVREARSGPRVTATLDVEGSSSGAGEPGDIGTDGWETGGWETFGRDADVQRPAEGSPLDAGDEDVAEMGVQSAAEELESPYDVDETPEVVDGVDGPAGDEAADHRDLAEIAAGVDAQNGADAEGHADLEDHTDLEDGAEPEDGDDGRAGVADSSPPAGSASDHPASDHPASEDPAPTTPTPPHPVPVRPAATPSASGSIAAAAAAGLALAVAVAGVPSLLPAALLALLLLVVVVPRRRRLLVLVALPSLVVTGPLLGPALSDLPGGSWRLLLTDPGVPVAADTPAAWQLLLGWPAEAPAVGIVREPWASALPLIAGVLLVAVAVLALLRGTGRARAVRVGWLLAVIGLALAVISVVTPVATSTDADVVHSWPGGATSLVVLGLVLATVSAADGLRAKLSATAFGWRQITAGLIGLALVLGQAVVTGAWLDQVRSETGAGDLTGRSAPPVPALADQLQSSSDRSRVLTLVPAAGSISAEIWRGPGPQLTELAAVVQWRSLTDIGGGVLALAEPDQAASALQVLVAELAAGTAGDAGARLGDFAVGVVIVPPLDSDALATTARDQLVARLDATAGLERVTENSSGIIWRVSVAADAPGAAVSTARVRIIEADGTVSSSLPSEPVEVTARVPQGEQGRRVVLAERADAGWRASYDGRPLRSVSDGWRQAFELPVHTGELRITYQAPSQTPWRVAQVVVLGVVLLLAVPVRRRRDPEAVVT